MIELENSIKDLFLQNYRQIVRATFDHVRPDGTATKIVLSEKDMVQNTFVWDRYCTSGNVLEIGSACAAEIEFTLRNYDGFFLDQGGREIPIDEISFEGKELSVELGISKWNARRWENAQVHYFPIGKFTVMNMPHKFSTIRVSALDRMTWFDLYVPIEQAENPFGAIETLHTIIDKMCATLHIPYVMSTDLPNYDMTVNMDQLFEENKQTTYRMLVQWVAALTGTCAYINPSGELVFGWLKRAEGVTLTPSMRYTPSTVYEPVMFGGLTVQMSDNQLSFGTDSSYRYTISDNSLIQGDNWTNDYMAAVNDVWNKLLDTSIPYRPYETNTLPMPWLEPLDIISYEDNNGEVFDTFITHVTFALNGNTAVSAVGQSETEAKIVTPTGRTAEEQADIEYVKNLISTLENATAAAREHLSDMVRLALGLHRITVQTEEGTIYYFTTAEMSDDDLTLEALSEVIRDSDVIYTFSGGGWVWCYGSDWDKEAKAPYHDWRYGITKDGTAVLGLINTKGLTISDENTIYRTEITPEEFSVFRGNNLVFRFNGQLESQIDKLLIKSNIEDPSVDNNAYIRLGSTMIVPADGGLDFVYVEDI